MKVETFRDMFWHFNTHNYWHKLIGISIIIDIIIYDFNLWF